MGGHRGGALLLALLGLSCCASAAPPPASRDISSAAEFLTALQDPSVSTLHLLGDIDLQSSRPAWDALQQDVAVNRSVVIYGAAGAAHGQGIYPCINVGWWQNTSRGVSLGYNVTMVFARVMFKKVQGFIPDFIYRGDATSRVVYYDCIKYLYTGGPPSVVVSLIVKTDRPPAAPGQNDASLLPSGYCRAAPTPAMCWADAYIISQMAIDQASWNRNTINGTSVLNLLYGLVVVYEQPVDALCLQQYYSGNTTCISTTSSMLQAQEARGTTGWLRPPATPAQLAAVAAASRNAPPIPTSPYVPSWLYQDGSGDSSGGLSPAAKTGLAVGLAVGVTALLVVAASILLLRRRRAAKATAAAAAASAASNDVEEGSKAAAEKAAVSDLCMDEGTESPVSRDHGDDDDKADEAAAGLQCPQELQLAMVACGPAGATIVSRGGQQQGPSGSLRKAMMQAAGVEDGKEALQAAAGRHREGLNGKPFGQARGLGHGAAEGAGAGVLTRVSSRDGYGDLPRAFTSSTGPSFSLDTLSHNMATSSGCSTVCVGSAMFKLNQVVTDSSPVAPFINLQVNMQEDIVLGPMLGSGAMGTVYKATYRGQQVAVKVFSQGADLSSFAHEISILGRTSHSHVVGLLGACFTPQHVALVEELCDGSLEQLMYGSKSPATPGEPAPEPAGALAQGDGSHSSRHSSGLTGLPEVPKPLPLGLVLSIALDVASGLAYLHPTVIHRDLKPANILLVTRHGPSSASSDPQQPSALSGTSSSCQVPEPYPFPYLHVKISDFGLSRMRDALTIVTQRPYCGTVPYMAPECFNRQTQTGLTHKCDIFSFGVVLWEMLHGVRPWWGYAPAEVLYEVAVQNTRPPILVGEDRCPRQLRKLLVRCWDRDPHRRPPALEIVRELAFLQRQLGLQHPLQHNL